jgi:hypothetical protein
MLLVIALSACAKASALARPMLREAPVTRAGFPFSLLIQLQFELNTTGHTRFDEVQADFRLKRRLSAVAKTYAFIARLKNTL